MQKGLLLCVTTLFAAKLTTIDDKSANGHLLAEHSRSYRQHREVQSTAQFRINMNR